MSRSSSSVDGPLYEPTGLFMVRAPILPVGRLDRSSKDAQEPDDGLQQLVAITDDDRVATALELASHSLARSLTALREGRLKDPAKRRRARLSLLRYLIRMSSRPTPFGLFAGVEAGHFYEETTLSLGADPVARTRSRVDMGWLMSLVKDLEDGPHAPALSTCVNPLLYAVGDRIVLPFADIHGSSDNRQIDLRCSEPVAKVLEGARQGLTMDQLVLDLKKKLPTSTQEQCQGLVRQLWDVHVIMSDLRAPTSHPAPHRHVQEALKRAEVAPDLQESLAKVDELLAELDRGTARLKSLTSLEESQRALTPNHSGEIVQLDTLLSLQGDRVSHKVGQAAAEAADVLMRIGCVRPRYEHLVGYEQAFIERYGLLAEVPVLELLSAERGLEAPTTYEHPRRTFALDSASSESGLQPRDMAIASILTEAMHNGEQVLELTDERLEQLTVWRPGDTPIRPSLELYTQVCASSRQAIDDGDFTLAVSPGGTDGGRTFGRFSDLLGEPARQSLRALARFEEEASPGVRYVELNYLPAVARSANVSHHHSKLHQLELCVNSAPTLPAGQQVCLSDILVGATGDRLYLRWRLTGEEIRVVQHHMLNPHSATNVCRFLLEVSADGWAPLPAFDWGPMAQAPALPRVTRGRLILHPAQWTLAIRQLGGSVPDLAGFGASIGNWRARLRAPRHVFLTWADNRLLLDLEDQSHLAILHAELTRAAAGKTGVVLHEMLPPHEGLWLKDERGSAYTSELVIPLQAVEPGTARQADVPALPAALAHQSAIARSPELADGPWTSLKVYCAEGQQESLLALRLPPLIEELRSSGQLDRWFFIRYGDPHPHLRLRLRAVDGSGNAQFGQHIIAWAAGLVTQGVAQDIAVVSYRREVERYGGLAMIDHAERFFQICSEQAMSAIALRYDHQLPLDDDVLGAWMLHHTYRAWGRDAMEGESGDPQAPLTDAARQRFREVRKTLCGLIVPSDLDRDLEAEQVRTALQPGLDRVEESLRDLSLRAGTLAADDELAGSLTGLVGSISHMRFNRMFSPSQEVETRSHPLWWQAVGALRRRRTALAEKETG